MAGTSSVDVATELMIAWLRNPNNRGQADEVSALLTRLHKVAEQLGAAQQSASEAGSDHPSGQRLTPAVSVRQSLASPEHIISLIDGKPYRSLTRHLSAKGLTPAEYRQRYGLRADYPMVAPGYSEARRASALMRGLGRKTTRAVEATVDAVATPAKKVVKRARISAAEAREAARAHFGQSGK
jgi:predicted transcriptional regulator